MVEWIEVNSQTFNIFELRIEFLGEGDQAKTLVEGSHLIEIEDEAAEEEVAEVAPDAKVPFVPPPSV